MTKTAAINMKMSRPLVTITFVLFFSLDDLACLSLSTSLQVGMVKDTVLDLKDSVTKLLLSVYDSSSSHSTITTHLPCSLSTILNKIHCNFLLFYKPSFLIPPFQTTFLEVCLSSQHCHFCHFPFLLL